MDEPIRGYSWWQRLIKNIPDNPPNSEEIKEVKFLKNKQFEEGLSNADQEIVDDYDKAQWSLNTPRRLIFLLTNILIIVSISAGLYYALDEAAETYPGIAAIANRIDTARAVVATDTSAVSDSIPAKPADTIRTLAIGSTPDSASITQQVICGDKNPNKLILVVLKIMLCSGALGGVLCNMRGIFKYMRDNKGKFPLNLEGPFYVRPFAGALCGVVFFFVSNFFVASLTTQVGNFSALGWKTFDGMLPFAGIALLAGYVSQEFMERLKEIGKTIFPGEKKDEI